MSRYRLDSARDRLQGAASDLDRLRALHDQSVAKGELAAGYQRVSAHIFEDMRAALDYCARHLVDELGSRGSRSQFPLVSEPSKLRRAIKSNLLGVDAPDAVRIVEESQPWRPGHEWMALLQHGSNMSKHNDYPAQHLGGPMVASVAATGERLLQGIDLPVTTAAAEQLRQQPGIDFASVSYDERLSFGGHDLSVPESAQECLSGVLRIVERVEDVLSR